jgi:hypothetical protein
MLLRRGAERAAGCPRTTGIMPGRRVREHPMCGNPASSG